MSLNKLFSYNFPGSVKLFKQFYCFKVLLFEGSTFLKFVYFILKKSLHLYMLTKIFISFDMSSFTIHIQFFKKNSLNRLMTLTMLVLCIAYYLMELFVL